MSPAPPPPAVFEALAGLLRDAVHARAPSGERLSTADWAATLRLARQHGVDTFLYPWLAEHAPDLFSARAVVPPDSAPAAWRALFLEALRRSRLRRRQLADILAAFSRAGIDAVPLKGAWLSERVYDDPAQRSMSDLDLLVREADLERANAALLSIGYTPRRETLRSPFACDQSYDAPAGPCFIELHWQFASDMARVTPPPDLAAVWRRALPDVCAGQPARRFALEDLVAHLAQHALNHLLALPLRAYLDAALLLRRFGDRLDCARLDEAAACWRTGRAVPFLLRAAAELLDVPLPPPLQAYAGRADPVWTAQAREALRRLPPARARAGEWTMLRLQHASAAGRLRLVLSRVFMPRAFLVMRYPCARRRLGLPLAWALRARDLARERGGSARAWLRAHAPGHASDDGAGLREKLLRELLDGTKKPG